MNLELYPEPPDNPDNHINVFHSYQKDSVLAGTPQEYNTYLRASDKGYAQVDKTDDAVLTYSGISLSAKGFKVGQKITIIDEQNNKGFVRHITSMTDTTMNLNKSISDIQTGLSCIVEVAIPTREVYFNAPEIVNTTSRGLFRYPYLPKDWKFITPFGLIVEASRTDVKTFSSNITLAWEPVVQDTVIEEAIPQMDYAFFNSIYEAYSKQELVGYRPRDLNLNLYLVEILPIEFGRMHRHWVDDVKIKYKVHKVINDIGFVPDLHK